MTKERFFTWGIIIVLGILLFKACQPDTDKPQVVTIPAKEGKFDTIKELVPVPQPYPVEVIKWRDAVVQPNYPVDSLAIANYILGDSIERFKQYIAAIEVKPYKEVQEDTIIRIETSFKASGKVTDFAQSYYIKPQTIEINPKKRFLTLYIGAGIGNDVKLEKPAVKGNFGVSIREGSIFRIAVDTEGRFWAEYDIKL